MDMNNKAVGLDMPNGKAANIDYPQKFVQAPNPNKPGPSNQSAKKAPTLSEAMRGMTK